LMWRNRRGLAPCDRGGKQGTLYAHLRHDVIKWTFTDHPPAFVPGDDFVLARRNIAQLEIAFGIGDRVVRIRGDDHLGIHPHVTGIAAEVDRTLARHGATDLLPRANEGKVVIGAARHVYGMQNWVATPDGDYAFRRNQQDVRFVAATLLVEEAARERKIHGFSGGDVLQVDDGVRHASVGGNHQTLEIAMLLAKGIADLRIFINVGNKEVGQCALPLHGTFDRSPVFDRDNSIGSLRRAELRRQENRH